MCLMSNLIRKFSRQEEKDKQINLHKTYGKKPKCFCQKCKKKILFFTSKERNVYCVRCNQLVAINKK